MVSLAASADGCLVASSALDSHVRVWNARTHETRVVIATPPGENWHLGFIPDSTQGGGGSSLLAVAAGAAKAVKVYDVSEGTSCVSQIHLPVLSLTRLRLFGPITLTDVHTSSNTSFYISSNTRPTRD